jgi:hypothetical protein
MFNSAVTAFLGLPRTRYRSGPSARHVCETSVPSIATGAHAKVSSMSLALDLFRCCSHCGTQVARPVVQLRCRFDVTMDASARNVFSRPTASRLCEAWPADFVTLRVQTPTFLVREFVPKAEVHCFVHPCHLERTILSPSSSSWAQLTGPGLLLQLHTSSCEMPHRTKVAKVPSHFRYCALNLPSSFLDLFS